MAKDFFGLSWLSKFLQDHGQIDVMIAKVLPTVATLGIRLQGGLLMDDRLLQQQPCFGPLAAVFQEDGQVVQADPKLHLHERALGGQTFHQVMALAAIFLRPRSFELPQDHSQIAVNPRQVVVAIALGAKFNELFQTLPGQVEGCRGFLKAVDLAEEMSLP